MSNPTEYQEEYCGMGGGPGGRGRKSGKGSGIVECSKSYEVQPVGGKAQARAREAARAAKSGRLPVQDERLVATVYSGSDQGTHRIQPHWRDHRWDDARRADSSTLYEPADRDPCNRNNFYVYKSTTVDPASTPCKPLAVPDVHKLRYMTNEYMTADDWY